jgi:hypothetical protein
MSSRSQANAYEVYCNHCSVTFPADQRHCLHCGGRLSKERLEPGGFAIPFDHPQEVEVPDDPAPRRLPFSPLAIIWALLLIGGSIYRACAGE